MRLLPLVFIFSAAIAAADTPAKKPPVLAGVDVFGAHRVSADELVAAAGFTIGMPAALDDPAFDKAIEDATAAIKAKWDFAFVKVSPINYFGTGPDAGKTYVTIDVVEKGDEARMKFAAAPKGTVKDPAGLVAAWNAYEDKMWPLLQKGELEVGKCRGGLHCALGFGHDSLRDLEDAFIDGAPKHWRALRDVLRKDKDVAKRAAAAFVLAYAGPADRVVTALVPSIDDPSGLVRNNVVRVLVEIQEKSKKPIVPVGPLLRALRMPEVTDRNKAAYALQYLVATDPDRFRAQVLKEAGDTLVEMTALAQPNNRDPAVAILTSLAGKDLGSPAAWRAWVNAQRSPK
ncbi:MAG TPA: HEAT repeat domain-containing protein [Kofleriaceae bacterium]|nr:HEAT repeat domain-containing protein [Kofleriaceae bacterium]